MFGVIGVSRSMFRIIAVALGLVAIALPALAWNVECKPNDMGLSHPASNLHFRVSDRVPKAIEMRYTMKVIFDDGALNLVVGGKPQDLDYFIDNQRLPTLKIHTKNQSSDSDSVGYISIPIHPDWERGGRGRTQFVGTFHLTEDRGVSVAVMVGNCEQR